MYRYNRLEKAIKRRKSLSIKINLPNLPIIPYQTTFKRTVMKFKTMKMKNITMIIIRKSLIILDSRSSLYSIISKMRRFYTLLVSIAYRRLIITNSNCMSFRSQ